MKAYYKRVRARDWILFLLPYTATSVGVNDSVKRRERYNLRTILSILTVRLCLYIATLSTKQHILNYRVSLVSERRNTRAATMAYTMITWYHNTHTGHNRFRVRASLVETRHWDRDMIHLTITHHCQFHHHKSSERLIYTHPAKLRG